MNKKVLITGASGLISRMTGMKDEHPYKESVIKKGYRVINCKSCCYWHVYPTPSESELNAYYKNKYYKTLNDNPTMADKLNDPDGFYFMQYEDRLRHIIKVLPPDLPKTIIDIGAGYGDFLNFMKERAWSVQGIEPSKIAYKNIKNKRLNIMLCSIDELFQAKLKPSSVVTLNNVLEHLRDPRKIIDIIRRYLLLPRGILFVIVPNDFNVLQNLIMETILKNNPEKQYYWVAPLDHLNYWSTKSIRKFLDKYGFKTLYLTTDFPMEIFPLLGEDYITHPQVGRNAHLKRVRFEKYHHEARAEKFKDLLFNSFAKIGIGRDMQVIATIKNKY